MDGAHVPCNVIPKTKCNDTGMNTFTHRVIQHHDHHVFQKINVKMK